MLGFLVRENRVLLAFLYFIEPFLNYIRPMIATLLKLLEFVLISQSAFKDIH